MASGGGGGGGGGLFGRFRSKGALVAEEGATTNVVSESSITFQLSELMSLQRLKKIGHGAYGSVYLFKDKRPGAPLSLYAVKIIKLDSSDDRIEKFQNEVAILRSCKSEYIVQYYFSLIKGTQLWFFMSYVPGGSCGHVLRKCGPFAESSCASVLHDCIAGLAYLNNEGRLHLDIKPANMLLTMEGRCKLCDLGVAQVLGTETRSEALDEATAEEGESSAGGSGSGGGGGGGGGTPSKSLAKTKEANKRLRMAGTLMYMSPEMLQRKANTASTDIWSLGMSAIELATGKLPYSELKRARAISVIVHYPPPTLEGKFSASFVDFVSQSLTKDPEARPNPIKMADHKFIKGAKPSSKLVEAIRKAAAISNDGHSSRSESSEEDSEDELQRRYRNGDNFEWDFD